MSAAMITQATKAYIKDVAVKMLVVESQLYPSLDLCRGRSGTSSLKRTHKLQ